MVALLGRTNVGKSTLLNRMVGAKVSIATDKRQTTRRSVHGVLTEGHVQAVFIDTPGLHKPEDPESKRLLREAREALIDVDLVLCLVEPGDRAERGTTYLLEYLRAAEDPPALLVVNKCDTAEVGDPAVIQTVQALTKAYPFLRAFPISAQEGAGVDLLLEEVFKHLPPGPFLYPPDEVSNVPQTFYAAEIVREKAMEATRDEIPHAIGVEVKELRRDEDGAYVIKTVLFVDRQSRKGILIGAQGRKINAIRKRAQRELQELLETPVRLTTSVEVRKGWRKRTSAGDL
jgi:GTP-binding protein Era